MPAKPVQISLDIELLDRVDRDPETQAEGRSAFIRNAVERYLAAKQRQRIDAQIAEAYGQKADELREEAVDLMESQAWPAD